MSEYLLICKRSYSIASQIEVLPKNPPILGAYLTKYTALDTFIRFRFWETDSDGNQYEVIDALPEDWYQDSDGHYSNGRVHYRYISAPVWCLSINTADDMFLLIYEYGLEIIKVPSFPEDKLVLVMTRSYGYEGWDF